MQADRNRPKDPPCPNAGFEAGVIQEVERLVSELPPGTANLRISRIPDHPEWPEPYFAVIPTNSRAARFEGFVVADDLTLTVGEAVREFIGFARGGTLFRGACWQQELHWIWKAVESGGFTQRHYLDTHGKIIGWTTKLPVNGREIVFRNGRRAERLFAREIVRTVTYAPYSSGH